MASLETPTWFRVPAVLWTGCGAVRRIGEEAKRLGARRAVVVCDPGVAQVGLAARVQRLLEEAGLQVEVYPHAQPEPTTESADRCAAFVRDGGFDLVVGLGGGSAMDTAKLAAVLAVHGGHCQDFLGADLVPGRGLPTILVPTTAGTGAEATPNAVFKEVPSGTKRTIISPHIIPDVALVDPELTLTLPPALTASTGMDALSHAIEAYTSRRATPHGDLYALEAIRLIGANLRRAVAHGDDLEARSGMALASLYAGIAIAHAGTNGVHAVAYPLSGRFGIPHGVANGVMLASVVAFNAPAAPARFAQVAQALGVREGDTESLARAAGEAVAQLARDIGIPQRLRDLGIPEDALRPMSEEAASIRRLLQFNPREMRPEDVEAMYRAIY
ncbi:MAG: iron-containing alcohol dehydrogenase [Anaerolineae bacterium]|nr:iron-containing alcohol dehydrogenase [Anaerolineae bacterium]